MCGFLGEFLFQDTALTSSAEFKALLKLSKRRGPDSTAIITTSKFQLGFNRLAILDLSPNGDQPMQSPSKRYSIVFNGEIYNFKALAAKYKLTDLHSTSDTEVIAHLLDKMGVQQTIKALNGMFAIAIVDNISNGLYLTRDFAGIKPLFYGISKQGMVCASQFNQVFKHPFFINKLQLRKEILKEYFGLGYMQTPNTIYEGIFQVNPGEMVKVSRNGQLEKKTIIGYSKDWESIEKKYEKGKKEDFNHLFKQVIKRQLQSDVPLATFLSGGIDSPLVCAVAAQHDASIEAFTLAVDDEKLDESEKASAYAKQLKIKHAIEKVGTNELRQQINTHFKHLGEPFGDYSSIPTYLIAKKASQNYKVMLSGDGGDELFFGYPRMQAILQKRNWFKIPHGIRKPIVRLAIKLKLMNSWAPYSYKKLEDWILAKHLHISKQELNELIPNTSFSKELNTLYNVPKKHTKKGLLHWLRYNEFYAHMQRVLVKVDRMSMANSLEVRVPFLDKESIAFAWKGMPEFKKSNFELKGLLKKVMRLHFPNEIIEIEKKGFAVPIDDWLKNELKSDVEKVIFELPFYGSEIVEVDTLKKYVLNYFEGKHQEAWGVWHVYAWQKWAIAEGLVGES